MPDWVLMDIQMKELDGLSAAKLLKSQFPQARIVIVSKYAEAETRSASIEAGACDYVMKENLLAIRAIIRNSL